MGLGHGEQLVNDGSDAARLSGQLGTRTPRPASLSRLNAL